MRRRSFLYGGRCRLAADPGEPALVTRGLSHRYHGAESDALVDVSVAVQPGERIALVGPNGAGKSTFLNIILGLEPLQRGTVTVYGHPATECRHRVTVVPQRTAVDWRFPVTVGQAVLMGRFVHLGWLRRPSGRDRDIAEHAMERMGIIDLADRQVGELSGGQQQRVMLARALAHEADLLLLDEPVNHVDITTQELMFHTIEDLCAQGKTAIVSTHDLGLLDVHFSRALFLDRRLIADGPVHDVLTAETIAGAYGFRFHGRPEDSKWSRR